MRALVILCPLKYRSVTDPDPCYGKRGTLVPAQISSVLDRRRRVPNDFSRPRPLRA